tara:strand:+ start:368 stop:1711 length:1344 start_codon:yes stop_codon:yes gene_type:complete
MKYVIVGSGPTGLSLAYILALNNKEVILIEQDNQLGGSWNSQWIDNMYFSENSPRVILQNNNLEKLFLQIGLTDKDFKNIYGNIFQTNYKILSFLFKYFNLFDYFIFLFAAIKYKFVIENITLLDWMNKSLLSENAKKAITILSIVINDKPQNTNLSDFYGSFGLSTPKQMIEPNKWNILIEQYLKNKNNITILKNTKVISLISNINKNIIDEIYIKNIINNFTSLIRVDKVILCTQSNNIFPILNNSSEYIQNNWMNSTIMKTWSQNTFYSDFGFQIHFDKLVDFKDNWCWSCESEWTIIILPVSNWLKTFSKNPKIKTVWSCCITDMTTKSSRINKNANECNLNEVVEECLYQIKKNYKIPNPYKITVSKGLKKNNNKWISKNTGYTKSNYDDLEIKGTINNLYALGCFTTKDNSHVAYMGSAIDATVKYLNEYEKDLSINIFNE